MKVVVHGVTKQFTTGPREVRALGGINLEVRDREFFGIIGPTGCGKTTLLHIIARLEEASTGTVEFIGAQHAKSPVSMVFQESALMPWRTVEDNVPLGPEFRNESPSVYKRISRFFLEVVRLLDFASAQPDQLSGGMKQKVAIARALANDPEVIVMDEPFANLDAQTRLLLREELLRIWEKDKKTIILVTHSIEEAVMLCDRVAVMSAAPGVVKTVIPIEVRRPRNFKSMSDPAFVRCLEKIWDPLRYEVERAMQENHPSVTKESRAQHRKPYFTWWD